MIEHDTDQPVLVLTNEQSWKLLEHTAHGRLATSAAGSIDIFPVNYAAANGFLYLRTTPGKKLAAMTVNPQVAFEADGILSDEAWSVVVHGTAEVLQLEADIEAARASGVTPWIPTTKESWVRITPADISGRHFRLGPQPELLDATN